MNKIKSIVTANLFSGTATTGYSRLKNIFSTNIKYINYEKITNNAKNKTLGNLPPEFIKAAIKTQNKEITIKEIKEGFAKAANKLQNITNLKAEKIKNFIPDKTDIKRSYEKILDWEWDELDYLKQRINNAILNKETTSQIEDEAAKVLKKSMHKILPQDTVVKFKRLGEGNFAVAYKIEFRNSQNEKVFNDYTMKVYKNMQKHAEINETINNKIKEQLYQLSDEEIKELYLKQSSYKNIKPERWKEIIKDFKTSHKPLTQQELKDKINNEILTEKVALSTNGVIAEANSYIYISKAFGHPLNKTDLNVHYMFDIKNNFNISNYSDKNLPKVTQSLDFSKIGIIPFDAYDNYSNIVYGRIIDVGGMSKSDEKLTDKTVRKYFKKIVNRNTEKEKEDVINNLKKLISNPKTPLRNKIAQAIELAENVKTK